MTTKGNGDDTYQTFTSSLSEYGVTTRRLSPEELRSELAAVVESPAVGVSLPWDDVSLPESVTTDPTVGELERATTGVTSAALAIADYGSLVLRADSDGSEPISLFNDLHVAVVRESDIVPDMEAAFEWFGDEIRDTRGSAIVATGPSATADMGALVQGAHGPKEVEVFVVT